MEPYHNLVGLVSLLQGNHADAIASFEKANLNSMYVKYHLGLAQEGAGNTEQAKAIFQEVAQWNFNSVGYALVRKDAMEKAGMNESV